MNVQDIMQVASRWRCREGDGCYEAIYDLDSDGDTDIVDIMLVVARWGDIGLPDLSASTNSVSAEAAERADTLTYTIVMSNTGECDAESVVTNTVPSEVTLVPDSIVVTRGAGLARRPMAMSAGGGIPILIVWSGTIAVGEPVTMTFQATVNDNVPKGTVITDTAKLDDGKGGIHTREATTTVVARDLSTSTKSATLTAEESNETLDYTIVLSNTGDANAVGVTLSDIIPVNTTYVTGTAQVQPAGTGVLTDTASSIGWTGTVTHSESATITFQAEVNRILTSSSVTNTAVISDGKGHAYQQRAARVVAGSISGKVTTDDGVTPVSGADVYAIEPYGGFGAATTAANGTFTIDNLVSGCYEVSSFASGYVDASLPDLCVVVGQTTTNVDFALSFGGAISGTVTQSDGTTPIEGATMFAIEPNGGSGLTSTEADGTYSLEDLPEGTYEVRASAPEFAQASRSDVSVTTGLTTTDVDFALSFGGMISGTVTEDDGVTPIDGATLFATEPGGNSGLATSDPDGSYLLENLAQGTYEVRASTPGFASASKSNVPVVIGQTTPNIDFALSFGGTISGTVTQVDGTTPISGATVSAIEPNGHVGFAATGADGEYAIAELVASDSYTVTAEATGYARVSRSGISVTVGQTTPDVDFALLFGGTISGTVTEIDGTTPISGSTVSALAPEGLFGPTTSANDGTYLISELPQDTYEVIASAPGYAEASQLGVSVKVGQTTPNIDFALSFGGAISGTVTGRNGATPISGAGISALEPNGGFGYTTSAQDGTYVVVDLAPSDDYTITVQAEGYATTSQSGISVTAGQTTTNIDFALPFSGIISGTVTKADGVTPIGSASVYGIEPGGRFAETTTALNGTYLLDNLSASDNYTVTVKAEGYAVARRSNVVVNAGQTTPNIDFSLSSGGNISGTVSDSEQGTPIARALVFAIDSGEGFGYDISASDGTYNIKDLTTPSSYTVTVAVAGYATALRGGIVVSPGQTVSAVDFALTPDILEVSGEPDSNLVTTPVPIPGTPLEYVRSSLNKSYVSIYNSSVVQQLPSADSRDVMNTSRVTHIPQEGKDAYPAVAESKLLTPAGELCPDCSSKETASRHAYDQYQESEQAYYAQSLKVAEAENVHEKAFIKALSKKTAWEVAKIVVAGKRKQLEDLVLAIEVAESKTPWEVLLIALKIQLAITQPLLEAAITTVQICLDAYMEGTSAEQDAFLQVQKELLKRDRLEEEMQRKRKQFYQLWEIYQNCVTPPPVTLGPCERCVNGVPAPIDCDDGDPCTTDYCVSAVCYFTPMNCDDDDPCTVDFCWDGDCWNFRIDCDDGDPCTDDFCWDGDCWNFPIDCDDGDPCTDDFCWGGECWNDPIDCDDGDSCTDDYCWGGDCWNFPIDCDDGNPCTDDYCWGGECYHDPIPDCPCPGGGNASRPPASFPEESTVAIVSIKGGSLQSGDGSVSVSFPAEAVSGPTTLVYMPQAKTFIRGFAPVRFFTLEAYQKRDWQKITGLNKPVTIQVSYAAADVAGLDEGKLGLYYFDTSTNQWVGLPSTVDMENKTVTASSVNHFSLYGLMAPAPPPPTSPFPVFPGMALLVIIAGMAVEIRRRHRS